MLLPTGVIVPKVKMAGRKWELEGKQGYVVNMWYIVMCMLCYVMLCHVLHVCFTRENM